MIQSSRITGLLTMLLLGFAPASHADQWTTPTAAELAMTSIPEVPGASAVYLFREQTTDDSLHMFSYYIRLKVLTESGKEFANVELPYSSGKSGVTIDDIAGRTIHPDGSIVPFTGKPYDKLNAKVKDEKFKSKVFTLPAVEVGSILEYRYKMRLDDHWYRSPDWMIQSELFTRKAHYMWRPTNRWLTSEDGNQGSSSVAWTPILPEGAKIVEKVLLTKSIDGSGTTQLDLDVHDIPPLPREENMPPLDSVSYRVLFYYTPYRTLAEYWKKEGKRWSKARDKFIGPGSAVKDAVHELVLPSETEEAKLRKIYAAVMLIENTDFTREHTKNEEHAEGLKEASSTDDIWKRKRGSGDQLTALFIAMAREAGMKAYMMGIADRQKRLFLPQYLSVGQLDDDIAIVNVNGKDVYFDPGQRFCSYGQLSWKHSMNGGLRQTDNGVEVVWAPASSYKDSRTARIADLVLDEQGMATGTVSVSMTGDPALSWRQQALEGDETSMNTALRTHMEEMLPAGMEVSVTKVDELRNPDKPLVVHYAVKGAIGSATGKRLLVPASLFEVNSKAMFAQNKREVAIDMRSPSIRQDAVRLKFPAGLAIESFPAVGRIEGKEYAAFSTSFTKGSNSVTLFRNFSLGRVLFAATEYADLRGFYNGCESKDREMLVLKRAAPTGGATGGSR